MNCGCYFSKKKRKPDHFLIIPVPSIESMNSYRRRHLFHRWNSIFGWMDVVVVVAMRTNFAHVVLSFFKVNSLWLLLFYTMSVSWQWNISNVEPLQIRYICLCVNGRMFAIKTTMGFYSFFRILFSLAPKHSVFFGMRLKKDLRKLNEKGKKCAKVQITVFVKRKLTIILSNNDGRYKLLLSSCPESTVN